MCLSLSLLFQTTFSLCRKTIAYRKLASRPKQIAQDVSLKEIILSGGDPLMVSNKMLRLILTGLAQIEHLTTLRIHTRLPIFLPSRFTKNLHEVFAVWQKKKVFVVHVNHPDELDDESHRVFDDLNAKNWLLLNQAVLLKNINDNLDTLISLSEKLFAQGVLPYYLHQLDLVWGVRHFYVDVQTGRQLVANVREKLPGYLVPRYVIEKPGSSAKIPL